VFTGRDLQRTDKRVLAIRALRRDPKRGVLIRCRHRDDAAVAMGGKLDEGRAAARELDSSEKVLGRGIVLVQNHSVAVARSSRLALESRDRNDPLLKNLVGRIQQRALAQEQRVFGLQRIASDLVSPKAEIIR